MGGIRPCGDDGSMEEALKISIDYDGTMWSHMAFFRAFMVAMKAQGHEVGCLTGHNEDMQANDAALMVARGFPEPDFWFGRPKEYQPLNGSVLKSEVILREEIDIHFDDCDFGNSKSLQTFKDMLGDQFYRVIQVTPRYPASTHFE